MDTQSTLSALLADRQMPAPLPWVLGMLREYPAFYLPAALLLKRNPQDADNETLARLRAVVALGCPDRAALADYVDLTGDGWGDFYPPEPKAPEKTTDQTIDDFINKYGHPSEEENAVIEQMIFNPAPADYFQVPDEPLENLDDLQAALSPRKHEEPSPQTQEATAASEPAAPAPATTLPEAAVQQHESPKPDAPLMESLARIYIKKGSYARAYEIISKLSLKYPEKSVYFADQLRFLQKLIINQQYNG